MELIPSWVNACPAGPCLELEVTLRSQILGQCRNQVCMALMGWATHVLPAEQDLAKQSCVILKG